MATAEPELKTYWCHECDMSVALTSPSPSPPPPSPSPPPRLLCPHCHTHFLELMDSPPSPFPPFHTDPFPSSLSLFDSPFIHRLLQHRLIATDTDPLLHHDQDLHLQLEDPLALLAPPTSRPCSDSIPTIAVTSSLLLQLDPDGGGVVLCAVCKDPIGVDAQAKHLPCNHLYHSDCITPWLAHHTSCPLCRFQLTATDDGEEEEEEDGSSSRARGIRRQLRAAMMRLSELMEEEEDFYGLRTTLHHIAIRHGLLSSAGSTQDEENPSVSVLLPTQMAETEDLSVAVAGTGERGLIDSPVGGEGQSGVTG